MAGLGGLGQPSLGLVAVGITQDEAKSIGRAPMPSFGGVTEQPDAVMGAIIAVTTDDPKPVFCIVRDESENS